MDLTQDSSTNTTSSDDEDEEIVVSDEAVPASTHHSPPVPPLDSKNSSSAPNSDEPLVRCHNAAAEDAVTSRSTRMSSNALSQTESGVISHNQNCPCRSYPLQPQVAPVLMAPPPPHQQTTVHAPQPQANAAGAHLYFQQPHIHSAPPNRVSSLTPGPLSVAMNASPMHQQHHHHHRRNTPPILTLPHPYGLNPSAVAAATSGTGLQGQSVGYLPHFPQHQQQRILNPPTVAGGMSIQTAVPRRQPVLPPTHQRILDAHRANIQRAHEQHRQWFGAQRQQVSPWQPWPTPTAVLEDYLRMQAAVLQASMYSPPPPAIPQSLIVVPNVHVVNPNQPAVHQHHSSGRNGERIEVISAFMAYPFYLFLKVF